MGHEVDGGVATVTLNRLEPMTANAAFLQSRGTEPYWVLDPILVLILYIMIGKRDRIRGKAIGTAVGVAAALVVAILDRPPE